MDQNRFDELNSMIRGIAKKASYKIYSRSEEDIVQDLWVKVLDTEKRKGHEIDLPLAGRVCWDYINDMIDYDQRRNHFTNDFSGSDEDDEYADADFIGTQKDHGNYASDVALKDFYNKFPEGSKERIYLDFWGNQSGAMPNTRAVPETSRQDDGYTESALARMLGYASASSSGYKQFRSKMKKLIADYFDVEQ